MSKFTKIIITAFILIPVGIGWFYTGKSNRTSGSIQGSLGFPSDFIPKLVICADPIEWWKKKICIGSELDARTYELKLPKGKYTVFASVIEKMEYFQTDYRAYYSEFVKCGLSVNCKDHSPIVIEINDASTLNDINPQDWYLK
ncbi:MAG: hypothetical protein JNL11_02400 [Bdellovibrionaceae bacterium]|nr:hypothetical protein [Pseudobdellovibrionaceae bacterium]